MRMSTPRYFILGLAVVASADAEEHIVNTLNDDPAFYARHAHLY